MSAPETEMFDAIEVTQAKPAKLPREMSQAAIMSFFYGTLQLLLTAVGSALVVIVTQGMKAFGSALSGTANTRGGADINDIAEVQKMLEELGITDPSLNPTLSPTSPLPSSTSNGQIGFPLDSSPSQIVPFEFLVILLTNSFGILGLITAVIALRAVTKGKSGKGLAITGLVSCFFSFGIAFLTALTV